MTDKNCSRCGKTLVEPITENANYVIHDDFVEEEDTEVYYAYNHTPETIHAVAVAERDIKRNFDAIAAEMAHPNADKKRTVTVGTERIENDDGTFIETAKKKEIGFSIPVNKFDKQEVDTPEMVKTDDVAFVETKIEKRPVQKTGLVCRNDVKADDEILWGPDKNE